MQSNRFFRLLITVCSCFIFSSCTVFFETDSDYQARQALLKLMAAQEQYYQDNKSYAKSLFDIEKTKKYDLDYHKGIVYLEIESTSENGYRAVALPAESSTARVFAYDTDKGGFYEMDEEEVSEYVLGALRFIQKEKKQKNIKDISSAVLVGSLILLGIMALMRHGFEGYGATYFAYFLSLIPLHLSLTALNHMDKNIVFSDFLSLSIISCSGAAVFCLAACVFGIKKYSNNLGPTVLVGLFVSLALTSTSNLIILIQTYIKFS